MINLATTKDAARAQRPHIIPYSYISIVEDFGVKDCLHIRPPDRFWTLAGPSVALGSLRNRTFSLLNVDIKLGQVKCSQEDCRREKTLERDVSEKS